jgi:hypothetical protein
MSPSTKSKVTTDHDEIRYWAEERGAKPVSVSGAENDDDPGMIRLEFSSAPNTKDSALEEIDWDEWFGKFDKNNLALLYQEETANGERSSFNKIISWDTAQEVHEAVGGKGRSASDKSANANGNGSKSSASSGAPKKSARRPEGGAETSKRLASARGHASTGARASTRSSSSEKRSASATRGGATRGSDARSSRATGRGAKS